MNKKKRISKMLNHRKYLLNIIKGQLDSYYSNLRRFEQHFNEVISWLSKTEVFTSNDMEWLYNNAIQSYDNLKDIIKPK